MIESWSLMRYHRMQYDKHVYSQMLYTFHGRTIANNTNKPYATTICLYVYMYVCVLTPQQKSTVAWLRDTQILTKKKHIVQIKASLTFRFFFLSLFSSFPFTVYLVLSNCVTHLKFIVNQRIRSSLLSMLNALVFKCSFRLLQSKRKTRRIHSHILIRLHKHFKCFVHFQAKSHMNMNWACCIQMLMWNFCLITS